MAQSAQTRACRRSNNRSSERRVCLKNQASELLQDGVAPASKAYQLAPNIAAKRPCRNKQKAQEQVHYELLKRKASDVVISFVEAAMVVGRRTTSQGGAAHTLTSVDDSQQTTPSSVSASPSNDPNMAVAADDAHRIKPPSASASSSNRPNMPAFFRN